MVQTLYSYDLSGEELMQIDQRLLDSMGSDESVLHFFRWTKPSISLGCLMKEDTLLLPKQLHYERVRRPTGGGAMLHGHDLCFSLAVGPDHSLRQKPPLDLYEGVHRKAMQALENHYPVLQGRFSLIDPRLEKVKKRHEWGQACCMTHPTQYDLALDKKKLIGSSQRRKKGLLHQCSLHVQAPDAGLIKNQFVDSGTYATMIDTTSTWLSQHVTIDWLELQTIIQEALLSYLKQSS